MGFPEAKENLFLRECCPPDGIITGIGFEKDRIVETTLNGWKIESKKPSMRYIYHKDKY